MLAQILVALLAAAAAPPTEQVAAPAAANQGEAGGKTLSPLTVTGQASKPPPADVTLKMQGAEDDVEQMVAVWPKDAYQGRYDGRVTLRCRIDIHGLAESCDVAYESPPGHGFGKAALELRPTIQLKPRIGPDGAPVATVKTIAITFKAPDSQVSSEGIAQAMANASFALGDVAHGKDQAMAMHEITMLDHPVWARAASFDDLARAYPATGGGVEGYAVAHCQVQASGALRYCDLIKEAPQYRGFGKAALGLAAKFKVIPPQAQAHHATPLWVDIPIRLPPPGAAAERTIMAPVWLTGLDPTATVKLFPPEAVARGLTTGRGVARCSVGADGTLTACTPEPGDPDGLGFSQAAVRLAAGMRMNLWTADGAPVEGGVVHIPIRLNLKAHAGS
jgi:TonB family protein